MAVRRKRDSESGACVIPSSSPSTPPILDYARQLAERVRGSVGGLKLGLEFFTAHGPDGVRAFLDMGLPVFLDLKFHDIPNTVAGAARAAAALGVVDPQCPCPGRRGDDAARRWRRRTASIAVHQADRRHRADQPGDEDLPAVGLTPPVGDQVLRLARADPAMRAGWRGVFGA